MKIIGEIKKIYRETIKEHLASAVVFMLAMVIYAINCGGAFDLFRIDHSSCHIIYPLFV